MEQESSKAKTPSAWAKECLAALSQLNPDYRRNRSVTGRFIEFVRPDPSGLHVSQNFIRIRDTYYLCYALLFSTEKPGSFLSSPLHAGSRFDHNFTVWRQFNDDLGLQPRSPGYPSGVWSFGPWRSNTMSNLIRGFEINERILYPVYRDVLHNGKQRLIELFETARRIIPKLHLATPVLLQASRFGVDPSNLANYPLASAIVSALTFARGGHCWVGFGPTSDTVDLDQIPYELSVLNYAEAFLAERDRLDQLVAVATRL